MSMESRIGRIEKLVDERTRPTETRPPRTVEEEIKDLRQWSEAFAHVGHAQLLQGWAEISEDGDYVLLPNVGRTPDEPENEYEQLELAEQRRQTADWYVRQLKIWTEEEVTKLKESTYVR